MAPRTRGSHRTQTNGGGILAALAADNSEAKKSGRITVKKPSKVHARVAKVLAPPSPPVQQDDDYSHDDSHVDRVPSASSESSQESSSKDAAPPHPRQSLAASQKNPPSAVIISKLLSPDLSIMSELSHADESLRSKEQTMKAMRQPVFEARSMHNNDDSVERPKAFFAGEDDTSEDSDEELSDTEQRDDNSPVVTSINHQKRAQSKGSRESCSSKSENEDDDDDNNSASTEENEFQSNGGEEEESMVDEGNEEEEIDDSDSEHFINDSLSEDFSAEEESDYELDDSDDEDDEELEFDFDVQEEKLKNKRAAMAAASKQHEKSQKAAGSTKNKKASVVKTSDEEKVTPKAAKRLVVEDLDDESAAIPTFASSHVPALDSALKAIDMSDDSVLSISSHVSVPSRSVTKDGRDNINDDTSTAHSFASHASTHNLAKKNDTTDEASVAAHVLSEEEDQAAPQEDTKESDDDDSTILSDDNSVFSEDENSNTAAASNDDEIEVIAEILNDTHLGEDDDEVVLAVVEDKDAESLEEEDAHTVASEKESLANESFIDNDQQISVDGSEVSGSDDDVGDTLVYDAPGEEEEVLDDTDDEGESNDGSETVDYGPAEPEEQSTSEGQVKDNEKAVSSDEYELAHDTPALKKGQVSDTKFGSLVGSESDDSQQEDEKRNDSESNGEAASWKDGSAVASNNDYRDDTLVDHAANLEEQHANNESEDGFCAGGATVDLGPIEQEEKIEDVFRESASLKVDTPEVVEPRTAKPETVAVFYDADIDNDDMSDEEDGEMSLEGISFPEKAHHVVDGQREIEVLSADREVDDLSAATSHETSSLQVEAQIDKAHLVSSMVDDIGPMIESVTSKSIKAVTFEPVPVTTDKENQSNRKKSKGKSRKMTREGSVRKGKWALGSKIGTGSFGVVHVGMNTHTGQLMAVKSIELSPPAMKDVKSEVSMLKSLAHVNIVRYLGAERDSEKLHIFQEWVPGGSVTTLLNKFGSFSAAVMRSYLSQILTGLAYLHNNNILHRDIKGGNILISDDGIVKLADFGAAKRISHQQNTMMESLTMRGTPFFMAPEVFEEHYNGKADIWAVGCVAFQMATGAAPWKKQGFTNPMSLFLHLRNSEGIPFLQWPEDGPMKESEYELFETMLKRCFWRESTRRPTAHGLIADDFFTCGSSSEDDCSQSRALFSPGGDSMSTFTPAKPRKTPRAQGTPPLMVRNPKTSFLSPPLPSRIIKTGTTSQVSPLMTQSPACNINAKEWPTWAQEQLKQEIASPNTQRPSPKPSPLMDSLAFSTETSDVRNPFARRSDAASSVAMSTLDGLQFLDISQK